MKVTILGCGASGGVPMIGCTCPVCSANLPRNRRTRASIVVESEGVSVLVDTSPDMRAQCLDNNIRKISALIYTHVHADHIHGIDDVRSFNFALNAPLDMYGDAATVAELRERFAYVFRPHTPERNWYTPCLNSIEIKAGVPFRIGAMEVLPLAQKHGRGHSLGLRFGKFAYSTDTNGLSEETLAALEGIDTWIVDCLRYEVAPTHAHLEMTLGWIARVKPRRAYLTHMSHAMDYEELSKKLPQGVLPAHDGLVVQIP